MIASVGYDDTATALEIEFRNGHVYRYLDVPEVLYREFLLAASKGEYFARRIEHRFEFKQLK